MLMVSQKLFHKKLKKLESGKSGFVLIFIIFKATSDEID